MMRMKNKYAGNSKLLLKCGVQKTLERESLGL